MDFGVELYSIQLARRVGHRGMRSVLGAAYGDKPTRQKRDLIPVAHPDLLDRLHSVKQGRIRGDVDFRGTELTFVARLDLASELVGHQLHPVADAQNRNAEPPDAGIAMRRFPCVHAGGPATENDSLGLEFRQLLRRRVEPQNLRKHLAFTDSPRNHLRIL